MASAASDSKQTSSGISETLDMCLSLLQEEIEKERFQSTIQTLLKIFSNAFNNPNVEKYRSLKKSNKTFHEKVWQYDGAQQFMFAVGCVEVEECLILPSDADLSSAVQVLQQYHRSSFPAGETANQSTENPDEVKKRELITKERQKQLEEVRRMKAERKRISEQIKADRRDVDTRESKASISRNITSGDHMKRFEDIGIDLNRGGG